MVTLRMKKTLLNLRKVNLSVQERMWFLPSVTQVKSGNALAQYVIHVELKWRQAYLSVLHAVNHSVLLLKVRGPEPHK